MENILVCDDDKAIVDVIDLYLSEEGYRVFRAYDGIDGLALMKDVRIHLASRRRYDARNGWNTTGKGNQENKFCSDYFSICQIRRCG